jgi:8-amino-7-oxononanoate synthase
MASTQSPGNRPDIAIVGIGCRFPGAANVNEYWQLLSDPKPQFAEVPDSRWRRESFLNDDIRDLSSAYSDKMATVAGVGAFDAVHYKIPPRRARAMDPQHRLLVDLTREAIQDAGWEAGGFDGTETAVIMALSESGYREMSTVNIRLRQLAGGEFGRPAADPGWEDAASAVGGFHGTALSGLLMNMGPSSISSAFDLHGESYAVDAACSGGLAAVANAVHALREGRCRIALAGAAQLVLTPDLLVGLCRVGAISASGECRPFGAHADGFVLGEGAGVLVLRPLADAQAAGDRVYAVIRGVGSSNDGLVKGGMMPQAGGQLLALRRAYADAGLAPGAVGYLEAHGTGTTVGDRVEIGVLGELRQEETSRAYLGAAKAVVGHSLGASGIAGLIKSILVVQKGKIVPQPEFELAGHLGLDEAGLRIPHELTDWNEPGAQPRRAGVSAFGFGGTNVHVVLEESGEATTLPEQRAELLLLSARNRAGLARHARELANTLAGDEPPLGVVAGTLATRTLFAERLAIVADTVMDAIGKLLTASMALESGRTGELASGAVAGAVPPGGERIADVSALGSLPTRERSATLADLAKRAVSGSGLRLVMDKTTLCTLPPSPLNPKDHWIVNDTKRVVAPTRPSRAPAAQPEQPPPAVAATPAVSDVLSVVREEVSRTSAFPMSDLDDGLRLVTDLGFDSLMLSELEVNLKKRVRPLPVVIDHGQELTIAGLVSAIAPDHRERATAPRAVPPEEPVTTWDAATARVEEFPEVAALDERFREIDGLDLPNPYFRTHDGNLRNITTIGDREYVSFSSYNYLGLSGHPLVNKAVHEAVERYGSSVSASRLLAGERQLTRLLEQELAALVGTEDCLALVSGHATNVTAIGHIVGPEDLIVHDALVHDSILQGCALSGATRRPFAHNDLEQLEHTLRRTRSRFRRVLLVVEGVYSMDGDLADLPRLIELKKRYGALLMIDEAHSIGTMGRRGGGVGEFFDVDRADVDLWMGTLSKSLASCGGYLAGSARMIKWLKYTLPGFIYSVGLTPANAAAALAAIELIKAEPHRLADLRRNSDLFLRLAKAEGIATGPTGHSPIVPCVVGDSAKTLRLASTLFDEGIVVDPILYPAVDEDQTRLRFFLTSEHKEPEIRRTVSVLAGAVKAIH